MVYEPLLQHCIAVKRTMCKPLCHLYSLMFMPVTPMSFLSAVLINRTMNIMVVTSTDIKTKIGDESDMNDII